jgi:DNA-binding HxlR family transcriptional regulator
MLFGVPASSFTFVDPQHLSLRSFTKPTCEPIEVMSVPMEEAVSPSEAQRLEACEPIHEILARVGDKWTVTIVAVLGDRRMRTKTLHRAVSGISQRVLTACLKNLERDGLIVRIAYQTGRPHVEYELSDRGRSLRETLEPLGAWVAAHWRAIEESRRRFDFGARPS